MALKTVVLISVLLVIGLAAPVAEAQLGLGGLIGNLLGLIRLQGTLFCTTNGRMGVNGTATPVFANALVQLQCGGNVVSSATTNANGLFSIVLDPIQYALSSLLSNCNVVVNTPLSSCNSALPNSLLSAPLQLIGNTLLGLLNIIILIPGVFTLLNV